MKRYLDQLLSDIANASENADFPFVEHDSDLHDWVSPEEEDKTAPVRNLEEWTGISKDQLPPQEKLSDDQVATLLNALKKMLDNYNWSFVLQTEVPDRIQYVALRDNFNQEAKVKRWHNGFFELCRPGTEHGKCSLGEYCQCSFFAGLFAGFIDEELSAEEERARELEIEVEHLKKKHGDDWMKYYPYHLDQTYDDENGNPFDYGFGFGEDEEDDGDDWWRK